MRYVQNKYKGEHEVTIGVEFLSRDILIDENRIRLQVWDTVKHF